MRERPGPDDELDDGASGHRYEDNNLHLLYQQEQDAELRLIEQQVREMGPPSLVRENKDEAAGNRAASSNDNSLPTAQNDSGSSPSSSSSQSQRSRPSGATTSRSEDALRNRDLQEGLALLLVGNLRHAILSWDQLDKYLQYSIAMDVFTDSFTWKAQDFIREYQLLETESGRAPTIKLCVCFDTSTNQGNGTTEGRLLARLMDHNSGGGTTSSSSINGNVPALGSLVERPGSHSLEGPQSLPILVFPKTQEVALQIVVDNIMHRIHPVFQECFPGCHLVSLQSCSVVWNARRSSKAGEELEAALERAKYLRENGQLLQPHKNKKLSSTSSSHNFGIEDLPQDLNKSAGDGTTEDSDLKSAIVDSQQQLPFGSGEFSCADTVPLSQDFTVEMSQDFTVNALTESEFFNEGHAANDSHRRQCIADGRKEELCIVDAFPIEEDNADALPFADAAPSTKPEQDADEGRSCMSFSRIFQALCCCCWRRASSPVRHPN